jgi:hypothetical protein
MLVPLYEKSRFLTAPLAHYYKKSQIYRAGKNQVLLSKTCKK